MVAGEILLRGYGARKDPEAARRMFELAARDGHASALYSLGVIYESALARRATCSKPEMVQAGGGSAP